MIYRSTFKPTLLKALKESGIKESLAQELTQQLSSKFFSETDISDSRWFNLWQIELRWAAVCDALGSNPDSFLQGLNPVVPVYGILSWIRHMDRYYTAKSRQYPVNREEVVIRESDAAVCIGLSRAEKTVGYHTDDIAAAVVGHANVVIAQSGAETITVDTFNDTIKRLQDIECLEPRKGGLWLRKKMTFQAVDDD